MSTTTKKQKPMQIFTLCRRVTCNEYVRLPASSPAEARRFADYFPNKKRSPEEKTRWALLKKEPCPETL